MEAYSAQMDCLACRSFERADPQSRVERSELGAATTLTDTIRFHFGDKATIKVQLTWRRLKPLVS